MVDDDSPDESSAATESAATDDQSVPPAKSPSTDQARLSAGPTGRSRYRRLHTLSGAIALGAFVVEHLLVQASALGGGRSYDGVAAALARSPLVPFAEVLFVAVPLCIHAGCGIHLLRSKETPQPEIDRYGDRRLWVLQRVSAVAVAVFVVVHLWELRIQRLLFGLTPDALYTTLTAHLSWTWAGVPWVALFYVLGIFATVVHFSNGLAAAAATVSIGASPEGRKRVRIVTVALGLVLFAVGAATVVGLATGTRLLPGADGDSAPPNAPCGTDVPSAAPPPPPLPAESSRP